MKRTAFIWAKAALYILLLGGLAMPEAAKARISSRAVAGTSTLSSAAQSAISAVIGRDQAAYHATAIRKGFRMKDPRFGLQATFTQQGVGVERGKASWGMVLEDFGTGNKLQPVAAAKPEAKQNRVEYPRGALTEWYVNGPEGLEQGFTIAKAPVGGANGTVELVLRLTGNMTASVDAAKTGLTLKGVKGQIGLRYTGLSARDARGHKLRSWLEVRKGRLLVLVAAAGARYPLVVDPYIEVAKLTASDGGETDLLGISSDISADGSTVVAGAEGATVNSHATQGAVYVFVKPSSGWADTSTFAAKLTASDGAANDALGQSTAVNADGSTVVAGATGSDSFQGAVYVFVRPSSGWASETETAKLTAKSTPVEALGWSVGISGDGSTAVAGAPYLSIGGNANEGAGYIFVRPSSGWASETEAAKLTASDGVAFDALGWSVSMSEDGSTAALGAENETVGGYSAAGAVYVFVMPRNKWRSETEAAKLTASDPAVQAVLGWSVSLNADGSTLVAGSPYATTTGVNQAQGAAYVYVKPLTGWAGGTETAKLTASGGTTDEWLGYGVAVNADGSIALAGAPGSGSYQGAAYIFAKPATGWASETETEKLTASEGAAWEEMGRSSGISADGSTVVAGAPYVTVAQPYQGGAYVLSSDDVSPFSSFGASKSSITLGRHSSFALNSTFTLAGSSDGIDPVSEPVTLIIGNLVLALPAGSFQQQKNGDYVFSGVVEGVSLNAKFVDMGSNTWTFKANGSSPNVLSITNPVTVTLSIGNDSGTWTGTVPIT